MCFKRTTLTFSGSSKLKLLTIELSMDCFEGAEQMTKKNGGWVLRPVESPKLFILSVLFKEASLSRDTHWKNELTIRLLNSFISFSLNKNWNFQR